MIDQSYINFYFGEVVDNDNTYSKKHTDVNILFPITVKVKQNNNIKTIDNVKPIFANIKQIPVKGETVLIFQGYDHTTSNTQRYLQWYYFPTVGIQSNINNNILPINSAVFTPDPDFKERKVSSLQPYRGDILVEGRFGNTIRLGNTVAKSNYDINPTWSGKTSTDPIIILSNTVTYSDNLVVEDIESDASSLYLTSTQKLDRLTLSKRLKIYSKFDGSQFVGVGDRIILRAKKDIAVIDSERAIVLNTPGEIKLGDDMATEPIPHGLVLQQIIQLLVNAIAAGVTGPGGAVGVTNATSILRTIQQKLTELNSNSYKIKKT